MRSKLHLLSTHIFKSKKYTIFLLFSGWHCPIELFANFGAPSISLNEIITSYFDYSKLPPICLCADLSLRWIVVAPNRHTLNCRAPIWQRRFIVELLNFPRCLSILLLQTVKLTTMYNCPFTLRLYWDRKIIPLCKNWFVYYTLTLFITSNLEKDNLIQRRALLSN
jgi:hypothetical protein